MSSLSEWDTLALDERGRPCNGISEASPAGLVAEPSGDQLQVACAALWLPQSLTPAPVIARLHHGSLSLLDLRLHAECILSPDGRPGLAWAAWYYQSAELCGVVGLTVAGFASDGRYLGVTLAEVELLGRKLAAWADVVVPRPLASLGLANVLRFNQGDAYFARRMKHALEATPPGQAGLPLLYQSSRGQSLGRIQVHAPGHEPGAEAGTASGTRGVA